MVCYLCLFFYLLVTDFFNEIVLAVTTESQRIRTEAPAVFGEIKLETDSVVDVSAQIGNNSDGSELTPNVVRSETTQNVDRSETTQHVDRSGELMTGKLFLICKSS